MEKSAGVLLAISSLPSKYGIGCFSKEAYDFIDWLKGAGQKYWQILPLGPTGYGDSPYQSFSTFAGNPYFIDLVELIETGVLTKEECDEIDFGKNVKSIDYEKLYNGRYQLLRKAYERSEIYNNENFHRFLEENKNWVYDYSLFMAVKDRFDGVTWTEWAEDIRNRYDYAMDYYRRELYYEIEFQQYMQFIFYEQWSKLRAYANSQGIKIIGDIPIYVAMDSADVWSNPDLFQLDEDRTPYAVAGCPPDGFSPTGQLWGNPLYNWEYHERTGYYWWIQRMEHCYKLFDVVRIDHFRGFDEYYSIPYGDGSAVNGHWEHGPGIAVFNAIKNAIGWREVIAEDLGFITDSVKHLVWESGFPGMKVFEFAFDTRDTSSAIDYMPHNYIENTVAYTGTHDNETIIGWWDTIGKSGRANVRAYMCDQYTPDNEIHIPIIGLVMRSNSKLCIIPLQDYIGLDNSSRMNCPSTVGENWKWRIRSKELKKTLQSKMRNMCQSFGRI